VSLLQKVAPAGVRGTMSFAEDKILLWRTRRGDAEALSRLYEKYRATMVSVAAAMLRDRVAAEDVLHDVFVSFAERAPELELKTSLKGYLLTAVMNTVRNRCRQKASPVVGLGQVEVAAGGEGQAELAQKNEELERLRDAIVQLPQEQREVVTLRLQGELKFGEIARMVGANESTVRGRYRYGVEKLRTLMNGEVTR
jgi:RNA polymerase sigma-70 factor, ECF subfamily